MWFHICLMKVYVQCLLNLLVAVMWSHKGVFPTGGNHSSQAAVEPEETENQKLRHGVQDLCHRQPAKGEAVPEAVLVYMSLSLYQLRMSQLRYPQWWHGRG